MLKCEHYQGKMDIQAILLLVLRIFVGLLFLLHGISKAGDLSSFFGFLQNAGVPAAAVIAFLIAYFEIIAGVFFIVGLWTAVVGSLFAIELALIIIFGVFNSKISLVGTGLEYNVLLLVSSLYLAASSKNTCNICCLWKK